MLFSFPVRAALRAPAKAFAFVLLTAGTLAAGGAMAQSADLVLAQHVVAPDPVPAGGIATITMTVQNNGTDAASNVVLTDTIPPGSTFVSMSASNGGTCTSAAPYACSWASIPYLGARTVTLRVRLPFAAVWPNSAQLASTTTDPNTGNNALTRNITVVAAANLGITAASSAGASTIAAGTPYSYTLAVSNSGPDSLPTGQSPRVTFNVPTGSSITARPTGTGWDCQPSAGYPLTAPAGGTAGAEITCTRGDALPVGNSFPAITVPAVANVTGAVDATFDVRSNFPDGDTDNNTATVRVDLSPGTDMRITKGASLAAAGGSTQATYTLTARQEGGAPPTGVTVTDTLPVGLNYVSHSVPAGSPWICNWNAATPPNGSLTCTWPGTYAGGPFTALPAITLVATVAGLGDIPNTGTVEADPFDPNGANNTSTVTVNNSADLGISKTSSVSPVVALNTPYNWNITVRNYGPMPVLVGQTITVTETVPTGMSLQSLPGGSSWTCPGLPATGPTTVTCTYTRTGGNLAVDSNAPVLTIPATNTIAGALTNGACLALSGAGPVEAGSGGGFQNNCVGAGITGTELANSADLQITKTANPNPVVVGQLLTYTLVATNNSGSVPATNVHVYDVVNNLLSSSSAPGLVSITTTQGTCGPTAPSNTGSANVDCDLTTLDPGASATITIVVRPTNTTAGVLSRSNTASINSLDVGDPIRGNNSVTINSDVQPRVDATVTKTVNPASDVRVGQPTVYTVTARNAGPSTANELTITDVMPPNTAFISVGTPSNSGTCSATPTVGAGGTLTCRWTNVAANATRTVTFTVRPLAAALGTTISNTVNVAVGTNDVETDPTNNSSTITTSVIGSLVDILVQKTDSVDPVPLGAETMYTINIRNAGPSFGTNLVMTDVFPNADNTARFSYQGGLTATVAGATVTPSCTQPAIGAMTGTLRCTFPTIALGQPNQVVLTYRMRAESIVTPGAYSGTQGNHVSVAVDENETEVANNQVDEDTTTRREPIATDVAIVKTRDVTTVFPGNNVVYTLAVTNNGPLASDGAQVVDVLPAGVTLVSAPSCVAAGSTVTCPVGPLASGASRSFVVTVKVNSPYTSGTTLSNTATVDAPGDTVPGNNTSTVTTTVDPSRGIAGIPTMSEWGLILMSCLMGLFGWRAMATRRH